MSSRNTISPNTPLPWENLGAHRPATAFMRTAGELMLHPVRFAERMASAGGLYEPFMFFWITLSAAIISSFPLALAYFGLTAPPPQTVSISTYNLHLLPSRLTGFLVIMLPVLMFVGAVFLVAGGTLLYIAGQFFGLHRWEGAVTILSYAESASLIPVVIGELLLGLMAGSCYAVKLTSPAHTNIATNIMSRALPVLTILALLISLTIFFTVLFAGTIRTFRLDSASGIAATLAGVALISVSALGPVVSYRLWGLAGVGVVTGALLLSFAVLWLTGWFLRPTTEPETA